MDESRVVMHEPGTGRGTWAMGSLFEHLLEEDDAGRRLGVAVVTQPPGIAPPLHRHTHEDEAVYVLDGGLTYRAADETYELYAGCFLYLPRGIPHAFRVGDDGVRYLALVEPGHLLHLYDEVGVPAQGMRLPGEDGQSLEVEIPRWNEIGPRYGLEVLGPPMPG